MSRRTTKQRRAARRRRDVYRPAERMRAFRLQAFRLRFYAEKILALHDLFCAAGTPERSAR